MERINIAKSSYQKRESSFSKRPGISTDKPTTADIVSQHRIDDDEDEEKEQAALRRLKESGDLPDSLNAFLQEFQAQNKNVNT